MTPNEKAWAELLEAHQAFKVAYDAHRKNSGPSMHSSLNELSTCSIALERCLNAIVAERIDFQGDKDKRVTFLFKLNVQLSGKIRLVLYGVEEGPPGIQRHFTFWLPFSSINFVAKTFFNMKKVIQALQEHQLELPFSDLPEVTDEDSVFR